MKLMLIAIWQYRHFILNSIKNEFVTRFARSKLGGLWALLNPLAQVAIYALILSNVLSTKLPGVRNRYAYAIYLMAGLLAWNLFSEIVNRGLNLFIENGNLMKKIRFPRITLPAIMVGSSLVDNVLLLVAMLCIFLLLGHHFSLAMLWLPLLILIVAAFAVGIGLILGVMNVFIRDISQVVPIVLQVWFWFTPIVYPATIIPEHYRSLLQLNPFYPLVKAYQQILVYGHTPELKGVILIGGLTLVLLMMVLFLFRRAAEEMVDVL